MLSFECDYNNGACQQVIDNLVTTSSANGPRTVSAKPAACPMPRSSS